MVACARRVAIEDSEGVGGTRFLGWVRMVLSGAGLRLPQGPRPQRAAGAFSRAQRGLRDVSPSDFNLTLAEPYASRIFGALRAQVRLGARLRTALGRTCARAAHPRKKSTCGMGYG